MKAIYSPNQKLTIEVEGATVKEIFAGVAKLQEVFEAQHSCGLCKSTHIRLLYREVGSEKYKYYELLCKGCGARFEFGQAKVGEGLFPKRKDDDGNLLPDFGWSKYDPNADGGQRNTDTAAPAARPAAAPQGAQQQPAKRNGVPVFPNWQAAQNSRQWGANWLEVGGELFKLNQQSKEYEEAPINGAQ